MWVSAFILPHIISLCIFFLTTGAHTGAAPVPNDAASVPNGTAPVLNDAASVPNGTAPVLNDAASVPNGTAPVLNDTASVPNGTAPVPNDTGSVPNGAAPVPNDTAPVDCSINDECGDDILKRISLLEFDWRTVGRRLLSSQFVTDLEHDKTSEQDKRDKLLGQWHQQKGSGATYKHLMEVLDQLGNRKAVENIEKLTKGIFGNYKI